MELALPLAVYPFYYLYKGIDLINLVPKGSTTNVASKVVTDFVGITASAGLAGLTGMAGIIEGGVKGFSLGGFSYILRSLGYINFPYSVLLALGFPVIDIVRRKFF